MARNGLNVHKKKGAFARYGIDYASEEEDKNDPIEEFPDSIPAVFDFFIQLIEEQGKKTGLSNLDSFLKKTKSTLSSAAAERPSIAGNVTLINGVDKKTRRKSGAAAPSFVIDDDSIIGEYQTEQASEEILGTVGKDGSVTLQVHLF